MVQEFIRGRILQFLDNEYNKFRITEKSRNCVQTDLNAGKPRRWMESNVI